MRASANKTARSVVVYILRVAGDDESRGDCANFSSNFSNAAFARCRSASLIVSAFVFTGVVDAEDTSRRGDLVCCASSGSSSSMACRAARAASAALSTSRSMIQPCAGKLLPNVSSRAIDKPSSATTTTAPPREQHDALALDNAGTGPNTPRICRDGDAYVTILPNSVKATM